MKKYLTIYACFLVLIASACSQDNFALQSPELNVSPAAASTEYLEDEVRANCVTVLVAAWEFAAENEGKYPQTLDSRTRDGKPFLHFLPGHQRLVNPFTGARTEPKARYCAHVPGQTGFYVLANAGGQNIGVSVTGFGESSQVFGYSTLPGIDTPITIK